MAETPVENIVTSKIVLPVVSPVLDQNPIKNSLDKIGGEDTNDFKEFFGKSVVVDKLGKPKRVFHGSMHAFDEFDSKVKGDPSQHMGAAYYFTDSIEDVNTNYARVGPDLDRRINLEAEALYGEIKKGPDNYIAQASGVLSVDEADAKVRLEKAVAKTNGPRWIHRNELYKIAHAIKEKELRPTEGVVYSAYLRIENPVYFSSEGGTMFGTSEMDSFKRNTEAVAQKYGIDPVQLSSSIDTVTDGRPMGAFDLTSRLMKQDIWNSVTNPKNSRSISGQLVAEIFQGMGYDGVVVNAQQIFAPPGDIIDKTFGQIIGNHRMKGLKGTTHYVVWSSAQIRSGIPGAGK